MKNDVLVSIIIPVYNVEKYLEECLDSILNQNFGDCEIICIDDASMDNSYEIMQKYASASTSIKILRNIENKGLSYTRNKGIGEAVGKYIMFVDSDDMLKQNSLRRISKLLEKYKEIDILYYDMEVKNEGQWAREQYELISNNTEDVTGKVCTGQELFVELKKRGSLFVAAWRQVIRREFLSEAEILFYEGIYHEDNLFSFLCALDAKRVVYIPEKFYVYRRRDESIMSTMNLRRVQSYFIVFIELWNLWKNGTWSEEVNWLFEDFLKDIYVLFSHKIDYYPNDELTELGTKADKFMYKCISNNYRENYNYITNDESLVNEARKASKILVYGAGNVAIEVVRLLQSSGIVIDGILVSDKKSNPNELLGITVSEYDEFEVSDDSLIVVAIIKSNGKAVADVVETIKKSTCARLILYDGSVLRGI